MGYGYFVLDRDPLRLYLVRMRDTSKLIAIRLPVRLMRGLDKLAFEMATSRSALLRRGAVELLTRARRERQHEGEVTPN